MGNCNGLLLLYTSEHSVLQSYIRNERVERERERERDVANFASKSCKLLKASLSFDFILWL